MIEYPTLAAGAIEAIVFAHHGDPFGVLGPHEYENGLVVRAFLPYAASISVVLVDQTAVYPMHLTHEAGLYEVFLANKALPVDYQLQVVMHNGETAVLDDPYNFPPLLTNFDEHLMAEGTHMQMYRKLGAHLTTINGRAGVYFAVWAPNAQRVSVVGEFNSWDGRYHPMRFHHDTGVWELFLPGLGEGTLYKYEIKTHYQGYMVTKADPVGFFSELRPKNASIVWNIDKYNWQDAQWLADRPKYNGLNAPINIYEVHLGSWKRKNGWEWLTYQDMANDLVPYVKEMGFTHIELLPVAEHPFDGSWGYQVTGYFAPTSRFGTPDEFQAFVDACHQAGIGVILDWVPAHFPTDEHGLNFFDGTHLYEHADPRQGAHPDWGTLIFNYGRPEVRQFLISNALFWVEKYHIDGLRVDAVASMLYLDFSRQPGQWVPNRYGGRENLEAIDFIRAFNQRLHEAYPHVLTIAEESTAWPGVTRPVEDGGLGFDLKWNMGWMHDTLEYIKNEPIHRAYHHGMLTFSLLYAFSEKFLLPFSHDEVVHLKRSMLDKMPGDVWQRFANLRLLMGYQYGHPGKKLLFMGSEFGQWREWSEERSLDWSLVDTEVDDGRHAKLQTFITDLNHLYKTQLALYQEDYSWAGFTWIDFQNNQISVLAFARHAPQSNETVLVVCNFTPVVRENYRMGILEEGVYQEIINSDAEKYGGSNITNPGDLHSSPTRWYDQPFSIELTLPPLGVIYLKKNG
ncbi:MAG: 1,4-alpha-glucan branching protein GlgB [Chloroflexi bacterium]|nr:1,4-alpha-glucan branching protein GlgB [Chloroflexota bacterium]MBK6709959.1 1,4-alpha-glucan branching protein GlgB [Chloroflexota bacterium]MBK7917252.1 1,4-alpha-glucan branching protein GlgB [Chloroflexota bacterium]MBP6805103.1 1,4-alpha-glucan branching protein GlgB [Chloroflexota bacterium]MBP7591025.1 1,4-alpha-glucan branching protein GlgB [Chloroflexota bacterium]